ncbi:MAG: ABC transporter permease [Bacteroidota bacterium]
MIIFKLLWESLKLSIQEVTVNRLRSMLSLLGITIGIFAIISVYTMVDSLEMNIRESVSSLGSDMIYVQKWPWTSEDGQEYAWWKYMNRPVPSLKEYEYIRRNSRMASEACFVSATNKQVEYGNNSADRVDIMGVTEGFDQIRSLEMASGRYLNSLELAGGRSVGVIGSTLADKLFQGEDPVGKEIRLFGRNIYVTGVIAKAGKSLFDDNNTDEMVVVPVNFLRNFVDIDSPWAGSMIWVQAKRGRDLEDLAAELKLILRSYRRLKPSDEDTFALNQTSLINNQLDQLFKVINIAGTFIGIFSIIVGGFGIANIMFVSVKERTHQIGIQKAIGAKNFFIMNQFLFESVILSLTGGMIGLLIVFIGTLIVNMSSEFTVYLTAGNIVLGLVISALIGLISGFAPAWQGARMNPVNAINTTF